MASEKKGRRLGLSRDATRHALGIAEYHGPRSQMMRCIDHPTMLKDGSGWGAMAGVSAGMLAADGFTGAPALTVESAAAAPFWDDLGRRWALDEQVFKPYAVCYWAQAPIAGALALQAEHTIDPTAIARIEVHTFHNATRLAVRRPATTEEAQYSLPFPVAAALHHGRLGYRELSGPSLRDAATLALVDRVIMVEDDHCNTHFPQQRLARVVIETHTGARFDSGVLQPKWGLGTPPPTDAELTAKFEAVAAPTLDAARRATLAEAVWALADTPNASALLRHLGPGNRNDAGVQ